MYVILVYDIHMDLDGPRTWRKVFKTCKQYLHHVQNSVFEGDLTLSELRTLKERLSKYIRKDADSFIVYQVGSEKQLKRDFWGIKEDKTDVFL